MTFSVNHTPATSTNALTTGFSAPVSLQITTSHDLAMKILAMTSSPAGNSTVPAEAPQAANDNQAPIAVAA